MNTITAEVIGTIDVQAGTIHDASFETAAWYRTFEHPAQTVEVRRSGQWVLYTIVGRTTYEHFPSLFGGVAIGGGRIGECDEPSTYTVQLYGYEAAAMVEAGTLELADGYRVEESFFDHPVSCMGYTTDFEASGYDRYPACEHDAHEDAHGNLVTERNTRGNLPFGYVPGVKDRKRHIKIVAA